MKEAETNYDTMLFQRFLEGDNQAFLELFDRHSRRLGKYCRKMLGHDNGVHDLMQDLWEKVLRLRESESKPHNPLGWLYWMTRNLCLNAVRGTRHHASLDAIPMEQHPLDKGHEFSELEELVVMALDRLPLDQREVLILHTYSGYSFEEIASMTNDTEGAVRTRAWRARRHLKRIITPLIELEESRARVNQHAKERRP